MVLNIEKNDCNKTSKKTLKHENQVKNVKSLSELVAFGSLVVDSDVYSANGASVKHGTKGHILTGKSRALSVALRCLHSATTRLTFAWDKCLRNYITTLLELT